MAGDQLVGIGKVTESCISHKQAGHGYSHLFNTRWNSDVVSLCRTCWAISTVVLKALVEMPAKWRWQPPPSHQVLKLSTGESEPWRNRYWQMFQGKSENLLNLELFFTKVYFFHHLPHKPCRQRLPCYQGNMNCLKVVFRKINKN